MTIEERLKLLEDKVEKRTSYPIDINLQKAIENTNFQLLNVIKIRGGLPIYTSLRPVGVSRVGEVYLLNISGSPIRICANVSGTQYCATIT